MAASKIAADWPSLIGDEGAVPNAASALRSLEAVAIMASARGVTEVFSMAADTAAVSAVLGDGVAALSFFEGLHGARVLDAFLQEAPVRASPLLAAPMGGALAALSVGAACGLEDYAAPDTDARGWIDAARPHPSGASSGVFSRLALAAAAHAQWDLVDGLTPEATGTAVSGFNEQNLIRGLAAAAQAGEASHVETALRAFVARFPHSLAVRRLDWADLVLAARVAFHHGVGAPLGDVAAELRAYVRR